MDLVKFYVTASIDELMDWIDADEVCGLEKLCTARCFPGFPDLATRDRGDDWKGPMRSSTSRWEKGPRYQPAVNSFFVISEYASRNELMDGLLCGE